MPGGRCYPADVIEVEAGGKIDHLLGGAVAAMDQNTPEFRFALRPARFQKARRPKWAMAIGQFFAASPPTKVASVRRDSGTACSTLTGPLDSGTVIGSSMAMISSRRLSN